VPVGADPPEGGPEPAQVDLGRGLVEHDRPAVDAQPDPTESRVEHGERAPEGTPGVHPIRLRPEERRERVAVDRPARHGKVGQEGNRLARVDGERRAVDQHLDGAEETERDRRTRSLGHADVTVAGMGPMP
jgi:hypothetical protein